ncbi:FtsB family cell division protein [Ornithinimicrobium cerasi]|uniref:Cell division protein FtsB n=1 Tax=Ornithinimicrobium cerasi TaxID=2248773 RepID=A0A285VIG3_9MICO|nr:septum formation initiator family protein [Ornithinimicrobium cerasi]SOC53904.1 Cell division protein FtsB [Ornithinimicrobium cerasi]
MSTARSPRGARASSSPGARPSARPAARPASRRPGPRPGVRGVSSAASSVRRAPAHVRRLLTLVALVVVMGLIIAPVLSGYLRQRAEIGEAKRQIEAEQEEIAALQTELDRWDDPGYVERQARERLRFVKQGETAFTVLDDTGTDYTESLPGMAPVSDDVLAASPWYGQVWESVKIANEGLPETKEP